MPSKNGFGNSRTPLAKKAQYGVDQKNPIMKKTDKPKLPVNESDNTSTNNTSANITIDAVSRQKASDKGRTKINPAYSPTQHMESKKNTMFANDPNSPNSFVNKFFNRKDAT